MRCLLASLWPGVASVRRIHRPWDACAGVYRAGWLSACLGHVVSLELDEQELLEGMDLDGEPAAFPPGAPPNPSDVLSAELDNFGRNRVYEQAATAAPSI